MAMFLLDTDTLIFLLHGHQEVFRNVEAHGEDPKAISVVSYGELLHGAAKSARPDVNRREAENFAARLEVLPFDAQAAAHAADIRAALERQGRPIGGYDLLIAGHARSRGLIVVTGNRGEFDRVEGLRCEDWA